MCGRHQSEDGARLHTSEVRAVLKSWPLLKLLVCLTPQMFKDFNPIRNDHGQVLAGSLLGLIGFNEQREIKISGL